MNKRKHVGFQFSSQELTLNIDEFSKRYITPAVTALANQIDVDGLLLYKKVWNCVGAAGTLPATLAQLLSAGQKLDENGAPVDGMRSLVLNPASQASMVGALTTLYNPSEEISKQYKKGRMANAAGFEISMDQNVASHTVGALGGTPLVDGATQSGASILTKGWTSAASNRLKQGDVITFASVYAVNPQSKVSTGSLMQFVVTADFSSDGSGNGTIAISPAITLTGPYQNVDSLPADAAAIKTFDQVSSSGGKVTPQNLAFHKDAFALVMADLEVPGGVDMASRATDPDAGLTIRLVRDYDVNNDVFPCRLDVLYGWEAIYPELACRFIG
jgi:hypothetical protein